MEIDFETGKLAKLYNSDKAIRSAYGDDCGARLQARLAQLRAAACLQDMRNAPGRCHELTGDRKGYLAVDLKHPLRLQFRPDHEPVPKLENGGLDWKAVTKVMIGKVEDYH